MIEDPYGNLIASDNRQVALALSGATFAGGTNATTANASNGVATFSEIKIDVAGSYTVSAADGSLIPTGASDSFTISPAAAVRLVVAAQPSSTATAGQAFRIQPVVYEEDEFGNVETGDSSTVVSASLSGGRGPLDGTRTVTVSSGVAAFADLADNAAETISLTMASGALGQAISNAIDVGPAAATQLVVTTPPPDALVAGQAFPLVISAEDPYGNLDTAYSGNVTLSVPNDPGFAATRRPRTESPRSWG